MTGLERIQAAIGAGIAALFDVTGLTCDNVSDIHICGAFGEFLNADNAREIGLLPNLPAARCILRGNAALTGCEAAVLSPGARNALSAIASSARLVDLAGRNDFDNLFLNALFLRPLAIPRA